MSSNAKSTKATPSIGSSFLPRLRPFDTATAEGRSDERHRRAILASVSSIFSRAAAIGAAFVSVPFTIKYLGTERYGLWMTVSSISAMLAFSDFGMGNGLLSKVAEASGRNDREAAARAVTSALVMLTAVAAICMGLFSAGYGFVRWDSLLNLKDPVASTEAGPAIAVFLACFALSLPIGTVQRIQMAYQETFENNLWQSAGSVASLGAVLLANQMHLGLPWLIAAFSGTPIVVNGMNLLVELGWKRPWLRPRFIHFHMTDSRKLLSTGLVFLCIQVGVSVAMYSDNFIITRLLGPSEVARYSVGVRLFTLVNLLPQLILTPLWPAYSEAFARGDMGWIKATLRRTEPLGLLLSIGTGIGVVAVAPWFIHHWTRGFVNLPLSVLVALLISSVVFCTSYPHGIFIWGLNGLQYSALSMALVAVTSVLLKLAIIPHIGIAGAAWGTAACYGLFATIPNIYYARYLLRQHCPPEQRLTLTR